LNVRIFNQIARKQACAVAAAMRDEAAQAPCTASESDVNTLSDFGHYLGFAFSLIMK
jgi:geranylgeranyl pyrophosphate synthase